MTDQPVSLRQKNGITVSAGKNNTEGFVLFRSHEGFKDAKEKPGHEIIDTVV